MGGRCPATKMPKKGRSKFGRRKKRVKADELPAPSPRVTGPGPELRPPATLARPAATLNKPWARAMSLKFSKDHEWVSVDGGVATIGITDHAQEQLGDVVRGAWLTAKTVGGLVRPVLGRPRCELYR